MNKKMVFLLVLVLAVLAFALFKPHGISAAGPKQYKVIEVYRDKEKFEQDVTAALNDGWTLVGGVSSKGNTDFIQALSK